MTIDEPRPGKTFGRSYGTSNLIHDLPKKSVKGIAACWFAQSEPPTIGTNQPCCPEVWAPCRYSHKKYSRRATRLISSQYCKRFHVIWNHSQGGSTCETAVPQMTTEDAFKSSISQHCQTVHSWDFAQWFLPLYGFHSKPWNVVWNRISPYYQPMHRSEAHLSWSWQGFNGPLGEVWGRQHRWRVDHTHGR